MELANRIEPLSKLPEADTPYRDVFYPMFIANTAIETLFASTVFTPYLRVCTSLGQTLMASLKEHLQNEDFDRQIAQYELYYIKNKYNEFKVALLAELGSFNIYLATQKGGFDMYSLLVSGEVLFPADLGIKVPEAVIDAREAAKALAYEVSTACGFHIFRVVQFVLRKYYSYVTNGMVQPKVRNIAVYIHAMRQTKKGDEKILASLKQMSDLHRNPLIHPEVVLTCDEAISVIGMARSVVTAMLAVLPAQPPTTITASASTS